MRRAGIIGAGIGGLAAALALARTGWDVTVFEQAEALTDVGAGIQIAPNGTRVLGHLGLDPAKLGQPNSAVVLHSQSGRPLVRLPQSTDPAAPAIQVHRADLIAALAAACSVSGVTLMLGTVATITNPETAEIETANGPFHADLAIAADGIRSQTKQTHFAAPTPSFTGHVAWRALVPATDHPAQTNLYLGAGRHLVTYPLREGTLINIVAVQEHSEWTTESWSHQGTPADLCAAFADFAPSVKTLLNQVDTCHLWGLFDHAPLAHWSIGKTALLGDACHPMLPFMAQGACMALEDAVILAQTLDTTANISDGLKTYTQIRQPRTKQVTQIATGNARIYHLKNPLLRRPLHFGMATVGRVMPSLITQRYNWIYDFDATAL